jgi:hypothetical protein
MLILKVSETQKMHTHNIERNKKKIASFCGDFKTKVCEFLHHVETERNSMV